MKVTADGARVLVVAAAFVVIVAGLKAAASMLAPLMVAGFLAILCVPSMRRLQRHGVPEWLALLIVVLVATLLVLLVTAVVGSSIDSFQQQLPVYQRRLAAITGGLAEWLASHGLDVDSQELASKVDSSKILNLVGNTASAVVSALSNVLLVLLTMIFILLEVNGMSSKLRQIMGSPTADLSEFSRGAVQVQRYLSTKAVVSLATGFFVGILCLVAGVDFPLLWALLAFLFNFVPNIGSLIAAIPAVLLTLLEHGGGRMILVAIGYLVINMIIGNVVEPRLMGRRLGLSTLVVFLSMIFWGWVWGPVGMLLSVPLTVIVKIALEHSDDFRWIAIVLGTGAEAAQVSGETTAEVSTETV